MATASSDELDPQDVDERFAALVADLPDLAAPAPGMRTLGPRDWPTTPQVEALEEAETHFTPPDPGPQLRPNRDPVATAAWIGVLGIPVLGMLVLVARAAWHFAVPPLLGFVAVAALVASAVALLRRLPHTRDHDDDGAVV